MVSRTRLERPSGHRAYAAMRPDRTPLRREGHNHARFERSEEASFGDLGPPSDHVVYSVVDGAPSGVAESTTRHGAQEGNRWGTPVKAPRLPDQRCSCSDGRRGASQPLVPGRRPVGRLTLVAPWPTSGRHPGSKSAAWRAETDERCSLIRP